MSRMQERRPQFTSRSWYGWLLVVMATACLAQGMALSTKPVWVLEWRPADLAAIARNYYRGGFDFLHPSVLWGGDGPGYVEMECPLLPFSVALLYKLLGMHEWVAILIPLLCGIGEAAVIWLIAGWLFGPVAAAVAGLTVATSPAWIEMSTGLWPDVAPIFLGTIGLYQLARWTEDNRHSRLVVSAIAIALAMLLKVSYAFLGLPVLFLFWLTLRWRLVSAWQPWLFAVIALVPSVAWYLHAYRLYAQYGNTFGIFGSGYLKFGTAALLLSPAFYVRTAARIVLFHVTPAGALLAIAGVTHRARRPVEWLLPAWLLAACVLLLVTAQGVNLGHYQYALPVLPPLAIAAGVGFTTVIAWVNGAAREWPRIGARVAAHAPALLIALMLGNAVVSYGLFRSRGTDFRARSAMKRQTGLAIAALTAPGSLVVVADADMDDRAPERSMTPPEVFYFADRRGWYRAFSWLTRESLHDLRARGASYLAISAPDSAYFRRQYRPLAEALSAEYPALLDDDRGIVYDLRASRSNDDHR